MAENRLKLRICRIFRSCKSKNSITYDVLDSSHHHHHHNCLIEQDYPIFSPNLLPPPPPPPFTINRSFIINNPTYTPSSFSPSSYYLTNSSLLSPEDHQILKQLDGRKCPPVSPIISPLNINAALYHLQCKDTVLSTKHKNKNKDSHSYKDHSTKYRRGFEHNFSAEGVECLQHETNLFTSEESSRRLYSGGGRELNRSSSFTGAPRRKAAAEDEVKSLAVVKQSSDPYADFRASMVEMIVQNQIFAAKDLRNLLRCFLSLNASHYHTLILQVFDEISQSLLHHNVTQKKS